MRTLVVLIVLVAGLAAGAVLIAGSAAASHRAADASRSAISPSWSPDGKQVLFGYIRYVPVPYGGLQPSRYQIVRRSSKPGGAVRTIRAGKRYGVPLFWVPGGRIVYMANGPWYSIRVHGGKPRRVALPRYPLLRFILTPKRAYAAVEIMDLHSPTSIALLKLRRGHDPAVISTPLAAEERSGAVSDSFLSFSPHGRQLIFRRYAWDPVPPGETGPGTLMAFRLGGGRASVPLAQSGLPGASMVPSDAQQLQWSPDGRRVAFVENQTLKVVSTAGGSASRVLASCLDPNDPNRFFIGGLSWSPGSKLIAYDCVDSLTYEGELLTVRPDGTHLTDLLAHRQLTYVWNFLGGPQWSPDGSRLLLLAHADAPAVGDSPPTDQVWTIRPNGHNLTRLG